MSGPGFDDRTINALAALGHVRSYAKNAILIQEGDRTDQLYVVLSGRLKVFLAAVTAGVEARLFAAVS